MSTFDKRILLIFGLMLPSMGKAQSTPVQPTGYSSCSAENGTCNFGFSGPLPVAYGANGKFVFRNQTSGAVCNNQTFGTDPAPGTVKSCFVPTVPPGYAPCAAEHGTCDIGTTETVVYGANGQYVSVTVADDPQVVQGVEYPPPVIGISCTNEWFGMDPAPDVAKNCYVPAPPPTPFTFCAKENGTCAFGNASRVQIAYGGNGNFAYREFTQGTSIPCTNNSFGVDPAQGTYKQCFIAQREGEPDGYSYCSDEGGICVFTGDVEAKVVYGAAGNFVSQNISPPPYLPFGTVCSNAVFPVDPAPGIPKKCYIPTVPPGYAQCVAEGGTCYVGYGATAAVAYGANGKLVVQNFTTQAPCNSLAFNLDPAPGIPKNCYIPAGPDGTTYCSAENGTCTNAFGGIAYYGFDGVFAAKSFPAGTTFACSNETFGQDPAPGISKACFVTAFFL